MEHLRVIQSEYDKLEQRFALDELVYEKSTTEHNELLQKFDVLSVKLYNMRCDIVNGDVQVDGVGEGAKEEDTTDQKGVPNFWVMALKNNDKIPAMITKDDEVFLKYLKDIKVSMVDQHKSFILEYAFDINPFSKNSMLT
ncbi:OLC1v1030949C1 [Oldenlandia corymbosa var. corymbosa]|uniref:OLC1v1030949C1 n=1 Tax=Oldenlandia corymbosa var. corymbosa TaxID=529605 RepID=A0AAV1CI36_OLDCO|nr:OLC1v1030949C1 [Oldenlandia corymbosa var. corymbosa]